MLESMLAVAAIELPARHRPKSAADDALCLARSCYDHIAGRLGVALADALIDKGHIHLDDDGGAVTDAGLAFFAEFGTDFSQAPRSKRIFCRACLDWSERRYHVAGVVGSGLQRRLIELDWVRRSRDSRALDITSAGEAGLREVFGISLAATGEHQQLRPMRG
jgi:hypothetical protein